MWVRRRGDPADGGASVLGDADFLLQVRIRLGKSVEISILGDWTADDWVSVGVGRARRRLLTRAGNARRP
ncbi:hypothetical protein B296_00000998 [Ensete ventricosum]|uniref:Uncharacterized protein n=1 Tax=Ensete ventricosum TaxID=4639 RepID=A0A427B9P2_ENSVE|nr:hypothetical protein B296_00000998 [Ensete ventricosum]